MRAARFHAARDVRIETVAQPVPGEGEVLLRILACGVCASDGREYQSGPALIFPTDRTHPVTGHLGPLTIGHEFAGEVVEVGPGSQGFKEGALLACGAGMSCGVCEACRKGRTNLCASYATIGFHRNGGLAEFCVVPATICVDAGAYGLPADAAALGQPMAVAVHAVRRSGLAAGDRAVVLGVGGIGAPLIYAAKATGATVVVAEINDERLTISTALGADDVAILSQERTLAAALADLALAPNVIFEVSGSDAALRQAFEALPIGARVVAVGVQDGPQLIDMRKFTWGEAEMMGTVAHVCATDLPEALTLLASRARGWADIAPIAIPLESLVEDALVPLAERRSKQIKTLVDPWITEPRATQTTPESRSRHAPSPASETLA